MSDKQKARGKPRRGNREGSVYQRKDGKWCAALFLGYDEEGKVRRRVVYASTKREALEKLNGLKAKYAMGRPVEPTKITVAEHFDDWLLAKELSVASGTYLKYSYHVKHIKRVLGSIRLQDLDYRQINLFYKDLEARKLSKAYISEVANTLNSGLADAVSKRLIEQNPAKQAAKRQQDSEEARYLNPEELRLFLAALPGERLANAFIVAIHTGLRPGELLGLPWDAVDLDAGKITVKQALHEEKGRLFVGPLKSKASYRTISLSPSAVQALRNQRIAQFERQMASGRTWRNKHNLVFTAEDGDFLRRSLVTRRDVKRITKRASLIGITERCGTSYEELISLNKGLGGYTPLQVGRELRLPGGGAYEIRGSDLIEGVTLHTFRHTHASILIFQGEDARTVCERLGHADVATTMRIYAHVFPGQDARAASRVDDFIASLSR